MRIGYSEDIHRLENGRNLILCGVNIPFEKGCVAHSDGDVVFHAIAECIYGALGEGDLGKHFPDNLESTLNMDSSLIVKDAVKLMKDAGFSIENLDVSIICEQPKLSPFIEKMKENVSILLDTKVKNINIKACTNEKIGEIGKGNAIKAIAVCLLK